MERSEFGVLEDGRTVEFADAQPCLPEGGDTQCTSHRLGAWLPSRHAFVVDVRHYEGGHYLLVDARSGESLEISAPPHFSPDGARFATFDGDSADHTYASPGVAHQITVTVMHGPRAAGSGFERDGAHWYFADAKRPGHLAGPYPTAAAFVDEYARYRGRAVVAFSERASYERTMRAKATKEER